MTQTLPCCMCGDVEHDSTCPARRAFEREVMRADGEYQRAEAYKLRMHNVDGERIALQGRLDSYRWRKVDYDAEATLPPAEKHVLLAVDYRNGGGPFVAEGWFVEDSAWMLDITDPDGDNIKLWGADVTHWMPMPDHPNKPAVVEIPRTIGETK